MRDALGLGGLGFRPRRSQLEQSCSFEGGGSNGSRNKCCCNPLTHQQSKRPNCMQLQLRPSRSTSHRRRSAQVRLHPTLSESTHHRLRCARSPDRSRSLQSLKPSQVLVKLAPPAVALCRTSTQLHTLQNADARAMVVIDDLQERLNLVLLSRSAAAAPPASHVRRWHHATPSYREGQRLLLCYKVFARFLLSTISHLVGDIKSKRWYTAFHRLVSCLS